MSADWKPLEIRLDGYISQSIRLYVGNEMKAEITCGMVATERDWLQEISEARAARAGLSFLVRTLKDMEQAAASPDGRGGSEADRRSAFAEGLDRGLRGEHRMLDGSGIPVAPEPPKKGFRAFESGWQLGMAIMRAAKLGGAT